MTRIGSVTIKRDGMHWPATVMQYVREEDEGWTLAKFQYEGPIFNWGQMLVPGGVARVTHVLYRRAA